MSRARRSAAWCASRRAASTVAIAPIANAVLGNGWQNGIFATAAKYATKHDRTALEERRTE